jgi:hypothetical protein
MQIVRVPREQVEQFAREEYARQYGNAAPAKVRNAQALVALGEPRAYRWRGHTYRVPPVPFREGARLNIIAQALHECDELPADEQMLVRAAAVTSARAILPHIARRTGWRRFLPFNPFRRAHIGDVREWIAFALHVPDQSPTISGAAPAPTVDMMDGVMEFARVFPALMSRDGLPVSWAHYVYGMRHIGRTVARETLRAAQAARIGQTPDKEAWASFHSTMRSASGWE